MKTWNFAICRRKEIISRYVAENFQFRDLLRKNTNFAIRREKMQISRLCHHRAKQMALINRGNREREYYYWPETGEYLVRALLCQLYNTFFLLTDYLKNPEFNLVSTQNNKGPH